MKHTLSFLGTGLLQVALLIGLGLSQGLAATATFTNTPTVISNTYPGPITLQVGGLDPGETVVIQEFLDLNTNGVIDATDLLVQQFQLTDGQASTIGGIVNSNVPGDITPTNGAITAPLNLNNNRVQTFAGKYLLKLSSPAAHFTPVTNSFTITNLPYAQGFSGSVVCSSTNVPNALVFLFQGPAFESGLQAGVVADNSGNYSVQAPPGNYSLAALKNNYLPDRSTAPVVTLGSTTIPTNLTLVAATNSISGKIADAANASLGLPGVLVSGNGPNGLMGITFSDTNGNFSLGVIAGQWDVDADDLSLIAHGYVGLQNSSSVSAGQTGIALAAPKATALFYGSVKDSAGNPLVGIDVYANDSNNQYQTDGYTDANGNYCAGVLGGLVDNPWNLSIGNDKGPPSRYVYSRPPFSQNGGTNLTDGQAVRVDFAGLLATNQISGFLMDGGSHPISNVWISANATINSVNYQSGADTDGTGHYVFNVGNGTWTVRVDCGGSGSSLGSQYQCPDSQTVTIANNNTNVDFTALLPTSQIYGYVKDSGNHPISNVGVYAYMPNGGGPGLGTTTESSGYYSFTVANGSWNVGVSCCGNNGLNPLGYVCVGEQTNSVNNSTNRVDFSVPPAPYQITGHLRDNSNNPIANVSVNAGSGSYNACATTAGDGSFALNVTNGDWFVSLGCDALASLGYLCPDGQSVTVSNANAVLDFAALRVPYQITGWVKNSSNQPFTNLDVYAYTTIGTNYYRSDSWTDGNGNYSVPVANGPWSLGVDCGGLGSGYLCPNEVTINIAGASVVTNLTIQPCGPLQILTTSLPTGQVEVPYHYYLTASSCYPTFRWWITSGSLPPDLTVDHNTGEISGTPTTNGTFNFTLQVTDGNDTAAYQPLSLTIAPATLDVVDYYVMKMESFVHLDSANVVPDTNRGPFTGILGIVQGSPGAVPIANVYLPGGAVRGFPFGGVSLELQIRDGYATQAALDAVYTNGNYTFALATLHNGFQFPVLALPAAAYPAAQHVSNFAAAQAITPTSPFTLQWSNPSDATTNDYIWVVINNASGNMVFSTPEPSTSPSTALKGTATSVVVPASTFQLGATYTGALTFYRNTSVNTTAYPGASGVTLIGTRTRFSLAAASVVPVLSLPARISATQFGFLLSGAAGQNYTVLVTTNLALPLANWSTVLTTNLSASTATIQDIQATNQRRFYRVKVGL